MIGNGTDGITTVHSAGLTARTGHAPWFLTATDRWAKPYYDPTDLRYVDRELF